MGAVVRRWDDETACKWRSSGAAGAPPVPGAPFSRRSSLSWLYHFHCSHPHIHHSLPGGELPCVARRRPKWRMEKREMWRHSRFYLPLLAAIGATLRAAIPEQIWVIGGWLMPLLPTVRATLSTRETVACHRSFPYFQKPIKFSIII